MAKKVYSTSINLGNNFLTPNVIGRNSLTLQECIAELVANSLDWRITKVNPQEITKICIKLGEDSIEIIDNGVGMTYEELDVAIDLAESGNDIRSKLDDEERKGMYGLGMKVAVLSLGWKFTISTVSIKDPTTECRFEFNSRKLEDKNSTYLKELEITEDSKSSKSILSQYKSGSAIIIEDLVKDLIGVVALGKNLEERFSPDVNNLIGQGKLEFLLIDEDGISYELKPVEHTALFQDEVLKTDFEKPDQWARQKEYTYTGSDGKKYQLKGFIQLLKERSVVSQNFGLNLYCKGQLIERFHKDKEGLFTIAGRTGEKTYGELHIDGCFPDNVKAHGFIRDRAFYEIRDLIESDLDLYKYLSPTTNLGDQRIREEVSKRKGLGGMPAPPPPPPSPADSNQNDQSEPGSEDESPAPPPAPDPLNNMPEGTIKIHENLYIQVHNLWVHENPLNKKRNISWEPLYVKSNFHNNLYELKVYINPNSNLYKSIMSLYSNKSDQIKILSFFKKMAICECINQKLITDHTYTPENARAVTDEIVYPFVLKMKID